MTCPGLFTKSVDILSLSPVSVSSLRTECKAFRRVDHGLHCSPTSACLPPFICLVAFDRGYLAARPSASDRNVIIKGKVAFALGAYNLVRKADFNNYGVSWSSSFSASFGCARAIGVEKDSMPLWGLHLSLSWEVPSWLLRWVPGSGVLPTFTWDCELNSWRPWRFHSMCWKSLKMRRD